MLKKVEGMGFGKDLICDHQTEVILELLTY
jgi:hypothetical protein